MEASYGAGAGDGPPAGGRAVPAGAPQPPRRDVEGWVARVREAATSAEDVILEGAHAVKHALRFGADVEVVLTPDRPALLGLLTTLAPDVVATVDRLSVTVPEPAWRALVPRGLPSPALALAPHPATSPAEVLAAAGRTVVLEEPRHLGNLGAAVRVVAAAGAGGLLVVGDADPWHRTAVRAAAGLQFAVACARAAALPATERPVLALDPEGEPFAPGSLPRDAVLLFGTERSGLSPQLRARADGLVALPMRTGVSSLNLATAVAATLYRG